MPRGLASLALSGIWGSPVEFENRTVTGVELWLKCVALLKEDASGVGVKVPLMRIPLAWAGKVVVKSVSYHCSICLMILIRVGEGEGDGDGATNLV
jgi:hypothetical protein